MLVDRPWLLTHLSDPNLRLIDCRFDLAAPERGQRDYAAAHIPGAVHLDLDRDLSGPKGQGGGRHPLPDLNRLVEQLESLGIGDRHRLVLYDASRGAFACRAWWLLRGLGLESVSLLDGGYPAWVAAGLPVTAEIPTYPTTTLTPRPAFRQVDQAALKQNKQEAGVVLIDAREADRYRGEREPIDPVAGHIPGAIVRPWTDATTADGFWRSPAEQRQRWEDLSPARERICYCGSGVTACVNLFSLALAGLEGTLYPGSWSDWCSDPANPVATGSEVWSGVADPES